MQPNTGDFSVDLFRFVKWAAGAAHENERFHSFDKEYQALFFGARHQALRILRKMNSLKSASGT